MKPGTHGKWLLAALALAAPLAAMGQDAPSATGAAPSADTAQAAQEQAPAAAGLVETPEDVAADGIETIYVTGSSIRRIRGETALPVQVITAETIEKTGVSSVADLVRKLPAMQGGTVESDSIGSNSYGFSGVDIHNQGEQHTLVLLNGRRLAQFGGQTLTGFAAAIDLNSIPISAIERVEILTDGASAVYGSDAVAGVVNFITKKKTTGGGIDVSYYKPDGGADETGVSLSKGFGDYAQDGWNVFVSLATEKRDELKATERDFAESAIVNFDYAGQRWTFFNGSPSTIPANAVADGGVYADQLVSPYLLANGTCPALSAQVDSACYFDHVTQIQIYPERERHTGNVALNIKVGDNHNFFTDVLFSRTKQVSKIAPVPGQVPISADSELFQTYLADVVDDNGDNVFNGDTIAYYRVFDMGPRLSDDQADFYHVAAGFEGVAAGWDYNLAYTQSESKVEGDISGYPGGLAFLGLLQSGLVNPFVGPGEQSAEGQAALDSINYRGYWDGGVSRLQTAELRGSRSLIETPEGRAVMLAAGLSYYKEKFQSKPSDFAQANLDDPVAGTPAAGGPGTGDQRFGDAAASIPYGADRYVWGAFTELLVPFTETFEVTVSLRHDDYEDVGDSTNFKGSFKFAPVREFLLRGSVGTGFKAPTVPQLNASLQSYGVTASNYDCTPELQQIATGLGAQCKPNGTQYDVFAGGNEALKPEKTRQATLGFVFEPVREFSFGADYWWVAIEDVFGQIDEGEAFGNPLQYPDAWTVFRDPVTEVDYVAYNQTNINTGKQYTSGIDFNVQGNVQTPIGVLSSQLLATYLLTSRAQLQEGGEYFENIDDYSSELDTVSFEWQARWQTALVWGSWSHNLSVNYKSGYKDKLTTVDGINDDGSFNGETLDVRLDVDDYITLDWQSSWNLIEPLTLTVGALNLLDEEPPLSLTDANFPVGYDARYYDPRGFTPYARLSYKF